MTKVIKLTESELAHIVLKVITEMEDNSENETIIRDIFKFEEFYDFNIVYSHSFYDGNGSLTHVLEVYFLDKNGNYVRYKKSGNVMTIRLYFNVRNNKPYLAEMSDLPRSFMRIIPIDVYMKFFEEKGSEVLKKYAEHRGGFDRWV
jgi:prophage maintenance system killer protein